MGLSLALEELKGDQVGQKMLFLQNHRTVQTTRGRHIGYVMKTDMVLFPHEENKRGLRPPNLSASDVAEIKTLAREVYDRELIESGNTEGGSGEETEG